LDYVVEQVKAIKDAKTASQPNESTLFPVDFPAKTYRSLDEAWASRAQDQDSGKKCSESFAKYDLVSSLWRMSQHCLEGGLEPFSVTWPRSGTTRNGIAYRLQPSAHLTAATEFGLLPTPDCSDRRSMKLKQQGLSNIVKSGKVDKILCPTPTCQDIEHPETELTQAGRRKSKDGKTSHSLNLADKVKFATPQARDFRTGQSSRWENEERSRNLNDQIGGQLNPNWVEWLMGLPSGWTDLNCLETAKCAKWLNGLGIKSLSLTKPDLIMIKSSYEGEKLNAIMQRLLEEIGQEKLAALEAEG
jgi:hypothetical protein